MAGPTNTSANSISARQTLAVIPTGIADDPRCITNLDQLAKKALQEIQSVRERLKVDNNRLKQIVVGGPPCIASAIDEYTKSATRVSSYHRPCTRYLDDSKKVGDTYQIPSVRQNRPPVADLLVSEGELSEDATSEFDLDDAADRARVMGNIIRKLAPRRYHRAKQKAQCERLEHLLNDWFEDIPTASHILILGGGQNTHQHLTNHANGISKWVKYPTECNGYIGAVELNTDKNGCLSKALAAVFDPRHRTNIQYYHLSAEQKEHVQQWLTEPGRKDLGFPPQVEHPSHYQEASQSGKVTTTAD